MGRSDYQEERAALLRSTFLDVPLGLQQVLPHISVTLRQQLLTLFDCAPGSHLPVPAEPANQA